MKFIKTLFYTMLGTAGLLAFLDLLMLITDPHRAGLPAEDIGPLLIGLIITDVLFALPEHQNAIFVA